MTNAQRSAYWRAFAAACRELGHTTTAARNEYRRAAMREECGVSSSSQIGTTGDYERIMSRFWHDADRDDLALQFQYGDARRLGAVALRLACSVCAGFDIYRDPTDYIFGILAQMGVSTAQLRRDDWYMDVPERSTLQLIRILDTHRRRLARRAR